MLKRLLNRMPWDGPRARAHGPLATADDLYYCYRLLLNREPDEAGFQSWLATIAANRLSVQQLASAFMSEGEFARTYFQPGQAPFTLAHTTVSLVDRGPFKIYVDMADPAVGYAITEGLYEPHVMAELGRRLGPGAVVLDVGANIGYLTLAAAAAVGPEGRVIAVEPSPENSLLLRTSVAANGFRQVEVHQCAASDQHAAFVLEVDGSNGRMVPIGQHRPNARQRYLIFARPLDELLADLDRLDLVKLDIEGAEPLAINGMRAALARLRPVLISEFSPEMLQRTAGVAPEAYIATLRGLGYNLAVIGEAGTEPLPATWDEVRPRFFADGRSHIDLLATPL